MEPITKKIKTNEKKDAQCPSISPEDVSMFPTHTAEKINNLPITFSPIKQELRVSSTSAFTPYKKV